MQKYILFISSFLAVGLSALFSVLPIGIYNQAQVSALYPTLFTPAGFTFSIWSIIYASWIFLSIWALLGKIQIGRKNTYLFASAQILSSLWLLPSQFLYIGVSLIIMLSLLCLLSLNFIYSRKQDSIFTNILELFLGWIIIASIANIHIILVYFDVYIFPVVLTFISIILGGIINFLLLHKYHTSIPSLVLIWSCFGIFMGQENSLIQATAIGILVINFILLVKKYTSLHFPPHSSHSK